MSPKLKSLLSVVLVALVSLCASWVTAAFYTPGSKLIIPVMLFVLVVIVHSVLIFIPSRDEKIAKEKRLRVLFIDDDIRIASRYIRELRANNYLVEACTSLEKAEKHIESIKKRRDREDFVVMDMMKQAEQRISESDGPSSVGEYILRRNFRQKGPYEKAPVVILTDQDDNYARKLIEGLDRVWVRRKCEISVPGQQQVEVAPSDLPGFLEQVKWESENTP